MYALKYNDRVGGMISPPVRTKAEVKKQIPYYKSKGWKCDIVVVDAPKPLTEQQKKNMEPLSGFLKKLSLHP